MALVLADRVKETSTTTGTGTYTLAGAVSGFESFGSIGNGNTTYYACTLGADFEVGIGTYTSSGTTLARTTILQSSNSDNAVNWGSGTKTLFCTQPAEKAVFRDASGHIIALDGRNLTNVNATTLDSVDSTSFLRSDAADTKTSGNLVFNDSVYAQFGTSGDLNIFHNGDNSFIRDVGTGSLFLDSNGTGITLRKDATENMAKFLTDGAVELYHNNSKKLETTSSGVTITGTLEANAHRFGDTHVKRISVDYTGGGDYLVDNEFQEILSITPDGNSENYSIVGRIMATSGSHVHTLDINVALRSNTLPDLSYSGSYISTITGTTEYLTPRMWVKETSTASFKLVIEVNAQIYGRLNADVEIIARNESDLDNITVNTTEDSEVTSVTTGFTQYSLTKVYETDDGAFAFTDDVTLTGASYNVLWDKSANALEFADNAKATFGSSGDFEIYHSGSETFLADGGTGGVVLKSDNGFYIQNAAGSEDKAKFISNGAVELYHDNSKKLETSSTGATVTGTLVADGVDLGDNEPIRIGASQDLTISHDGSNSRIKDVGTGSLLIGASFVGISKADGSETAAKFFNDGAVELYHDNSKKLETTSSGITITGNPYIIGDQIVFEGATPNSNELFIQITDPTADRTITLPDATGTVLTTGNSNTPTTTTSSGDADFVLIDDGGTMKKITPSNLGIGSGLSNVVEDTTPQLGGTLDTANQLIQFGDSSGSTVNRLQIGAGQDLSLYHDGTNSYITHNNVVTSSLILQNINTDNNSTDGIRIETIDNTASGLDNYVHLPNNAGVRLGVSGADKVSVLGSGSFFNHDIILNSSSYELKFRDGSYYTILDAVISNSQDHTLTLPASTGTILTTGNSDTPTTTTSSGDADFVLVDDGGTMKKITPSNLGITSGGTTAAFATAMAMVL